MRTALSMIWTYVSDSISYDDNHYVMHQDTAGEAGTSS